MFVFFPFLFAGAMTICYVKLQPTVGLDGSNPPRVGNIGHLTRISNKLVHLGNTNTEIQAFFQVCACVSHS